jgi:hypothetical protein
MADRRLDGYSSNRERATDGRLFHGRTIGGKFDEEILRKGLTQEVGV